MSSSYLELLHLGYTGVDLLFIFEVLFSESFLNFRRRDAMLSSGGSVAALAKLQKRTGRHGRRKKIGRRRHRRQ